MYRNFIDMKIKKSRITKKYSDLSINILYRIWSTNGIPSKCVWKLNARRYTLAFRAWKRNSRKVINNFVFFTWKCSFSALKRILNMRIHIYTHGTDGVPAIFEDFNERGEEKARAIRESRDAGKNVTVRENDETSSIRVCFDNYAYVRVNVNV